MKGDLRDFEGEIQMDERAFSEKIFSLMLTFILLSIFLVFYNQSLSFRIRLRNIGRLIFPNRIWPLISISESEKKHIIESLTLAALKEGFLPQAIMDDVYIFRKVKHRNPSVLIAIFLSLFCLLPMLFYLAKGKKVYLITFRAYFEEDSGGLMFHVNSSAGIRRKTDTIVRPFCRGPT